MVVSGRPAPLATCRAAFCPRLALRTQPKIHSSTLDAGIPARFTAATELVSWGDGGWGKGTFDGVDAEIDGGEGGEGALEGADGGACNGGNEDLFNHDCGMNE